MAQQLANTIDERKTYCKPIRRCKARGWTPILRPTFLKIFKCRPNVGLLGPLLIAKNTLKISPNMSTRFKTYYVRKSEDLKSWKCWNCAYDHVLKLGIWNLKYIFATSQLWLSEILNFGTIPFTFFIPTDTLVLIDAIFVSTIKVLFGYWPAELYRWYERFYLEFRDRC